MIRAFVLLLALTAVAATVHVPAPDVRVGPFLQDAEPTSIWVVWETTGDAPSCVSYGASKGTRMVAVGGSIPGQAGSRIHHVQLTGLKPDTTHYYSIDAKGDRGRT
ncbi:MAG: fibronectin type III domain-containing protein, partial [Planctomycetota bacterium]|nr:fibronectin type III domain-containing protein [Planctomycetota bacterium]